MIEKLVEKTKANLTPRKITRFVVGHSVRFVISSAVSSLVPKDEESSRHKAEIFVGTYVLAGMVSDKAEEWTDKQIDELVGSWKELSSDETPIEDTPAE